MALEYGVKTTEEHTRTQQMLQTSGYRFHAHEYGDKAKDVIGRLIYDYDVAIIKTPRNLWYIYVKKKGQEGRPGYQQYFGKSARWFQSPRPLTPQETEMAIIRHKTTGTVGTISGKSGGGFVIFVPAEGRMYTMLFIQTDLWEVIGRER